MILVKTFKLRIVNDDEIEKNNQYTFVNKSIHAQYKGLNSCMGFLAAKYMESGKDLNSDIFITAKKAINNSHKCFEGIEFGKGWDSKSAITQTVKKDFSTLIKNGLAKGESNIPYYKRTYPLMVRGRNLNFEYDDINEEIIIKSVNNLKFAIIFGPRKAEKIAEVMELLEKIESGEYKKVQSMLRFDKNYNLILRLGLDVPGENAKVKEGRFAFVSFGYKDIAGIHISDKDIRDSHIGDYAEVKRNIDKFSKLRENFKVGLSMSKGGRGRKKKLDHIYKLTEKENNYKDTLLHMVTGHIVKVAKTNNCEGIKVEIPAVKDNDERYILNNLYEFKRKLEYKVQKVGLKLEYIERKEDVPCPECNMIYEGILHNKKDIKCTSCNRIFSITKAKNINMIRENISI